MAIESKNCIARVVSAIILVYLRSSDSHWGSNWNFGALDAVTTWGLTQSVAFAGDTLTTLRLDGLFCIVDLTTVY